MPKTLALIAARGGSKRIPRKNIKPFLGRPIIQYSIDAARQSECFDRIMVSTDDREIADIARSLGAEVPFLRSQKTANDTAILADVALEVLAHYTEQQQTFDYLCLILPTAPFITAQRLKTTFDALRQNGADGVIPVVRFDFPIQRALQMDDQDNLSMVWPEYLTARSQDLPARYHDSGQFYWAKVPSLLEQKTLYLANTIGHELPASEVQDIDTEEDWKIAETKYRMLQERHAKEALA